MYYLLGVEVTDPFFDIFIHTYIYEELLVILKHHCCIHSMMQRILENMEVEGSTQYSQDLVGQMVL
jgi:hypothetical protein